MQHHITYLFKINKSYYAHSWINTETNKGITQNSYDVWLKSKGLAPRDVRLISHDEVEQIYYQNYWRKAGCDNMSPVFSILAFDTAVNMGVGRVVGFLKAAGWKDPDKFIEARRMKYEEFAKYGNQKVFLKGWLNRLNDLEKFCKITV